MNFTVIHAGTNAFYSHEVGVGGIYSHAGGNGWY